MKDMFNEGYAKVGRREDGENSVGLHGYNDRNQRGTRFVEFTESNNLKILNSFFKKRDKKKWTWESPNGNTHNEIDFIMARDRTMFQDVDVIRSLNSNRTTGWLEPEFVSVQRWRELNVSRR